MKKLLGLTLIIFGFIGMGFNILVGIAIVILGLSITWKAEK